MTRTGQTDRQSPHTHTHKPLGPFGMPQWLYEAGDGWILIIHVGGKAIYLRDEL